MTLTASDRKQLVQKIETVVQTKYYDPKFHGKQWIQIVAAHRPAIESAASEEAFESAVAAMLGELDDGSMGLLSESAKVTPRNAINASFRRVHTETDGERWVFQDVLPGGVADRAGVRSADALTSVEGKEITTSDVPAFVMGRTTSIEVSRAGERKHLQLDLSTPRYKDNPYTEPKSITATMESDGTAVVKVSLFPGLIGIDFANEVTRFFTNEIQSANRLLLDLRGNPGGGAGGLRLMSYLTPDKLPVGYSLDRATAERGYSRESLPRLPGIPRSKWAIPLLALKLGTRKSVVLQTEGGVRRKYHDRIVVLVNEHSTGAAEMVTQFAQENRLAKVVGTKTPGRLVARSAVKIGHGYRLVIPIGAYVSWRGNQIHGKGITPDVAADWSYDAAIKGGDEQLDQALEVVRAL